MISVYDRVENIVGNGENACSLPTFSPFPTMFSESFLASLKACVVLIYLLEELTKFQHALSDQADMGQNFLLYREYVYGVAIRDGYHKKIVSRYIMIFDNHIVIRITTFSTSRE